MSTQVLSEQESKKIITESLLKWHHDNKPRYIVLLSMIMALVEKEHPEEEYRILKMVCELLEEFTEEQFIAALNLVEKEKEKEMMDKASYNDSVKELQCEMLDATISFMKYHFFDE